MYGWGELFVFQHAGEEGMAGVLLALDEARAKQSADSLELVAPFRRQLAVDLTLTPHHGLLAFRVDIVQSFTVVPSPRCGSVEWQC